MNNDYKQLRELLDSAVNLLKKFQINYNTQIGPNTRKLISITKSIIPLISKDYPEISKSLDAATKTINNRQAFTEPPSIQYPLGRSLTGNFINAYSFGDIRATIRMLDMLYSPSYVRKKGAEGKKIFISHSSKDTPIITEFLDQILQLGIGLSHNDIFCTSIEDMNIKNGEDIRNHIQNNIHSADFSFLMISDNYKNSEICMNEMGAVWAKDNNVRYYLMPNTSFSSIGWLCDTKQAEKITDRVALDKLQSELTLFFHLDSKMDLWSRHRETFIGKINKDDLSFEIDGETLVIK